MENKKKTYVEDVERGIYDVKNEDRFDFKADKGLTKEIVETISKEKNEPDWMKEFRLKALDVYNKINLNFINSLFNSSFGLNNINSKSKGITSFKVSLNSKGLVSFNA